MVDIARHPIWKGSPIWGQITPLKKRGHLLRIFLAKQYAKFYPHNMFIGISGTVGKTTTTKAAKAVLSEKFRTISTAEDLDPVINIPLTILQIRPSIKKVILEMGIEYPKDMDFYLSLTHPSIGIITGVSLAHSEYLGGVEEIAKEKVLLIEQLPTSGFAILNYDDPIVRKMADKTKAQVIFYGSDSKNCHIWAGNIKLEQFQTVFELNYGVERIQIRSKLLGIHQIYPLLAAAALGISQEIPLTSIKRALEKIESPAHRMQIHSGYNGSLIIDDTYNAAPISVEEAINTLNILPARRRIVILGEMRELGQFSEKMHRQIAQKIYKEKIDLIFLIGGDTKYVQDELNKQGFIQERLHTFVNNSQIVNQVLKVLAKGDVVLVKGARANRLDEVVSRISKK